MISRIKTDCPECGERIEIEVTEVAATRESPPELHAEVINHDCDLEEWQESVEFWEIVEDPTEVVGEEHEYLDDDRFELPWDSDDDN